MGPDLYVCVVIVCFFSHHSKLHSYFFVLTLLQGYFPLLLKVIHTLATLAALVKNPSPNLQALTHATLTNQLLQLSRLATLPHPACPGRANQIKHSIMAGALGSTERRKAMICLYVFIACAGISGFKPGIPYF